PRSQSSFRMASWHTPVMRVMERTLFPSIIIPAICARFSVLRRFMMKPILVDRSSRVKRKMRGAVEIIPCHYHFFHGLRGELHVTCEEGTHSAWLYDLLGRRVARLVVCNPRKNALLKAGNKSDQIDARKLA